MAQRAPVPGGRNHHVSVRLSDHEAAFVAAHRGNLTAGQYLAMLVANEQAKAAIEAHREQLGETD